MCAHFFKLIQHLLDQLPLELSDVHLLLDLNDLFFFSSGLIGGSGLGC